MRKEFGIFDAPEEDDNTSYIDNDLFNEPLEEIHINLTTEQITSVANSIIEASLKGEKLILTQTEIPQLPSSGKVYFSIGTYGTNLKYSTSFTPEDEFIIDCHDILSVFEEFRTLHKINTANPIVRRPTEIQATPSHATNNFSHKEDKAISVGDGIPWKQTFDFASEAIGVTAHKVRSVTDLLALTIIDYQSYGFSVQANINTENLKRGIGQTIEITTAQYEGSPLPPDYLYTLERELTTNLNRELGIVQNLLPNVNPEDIDYLTKLGIKSTINREFFLRTGGLVSTELEIDGHPYRTDRPFSVQLHEGAIVVSTESHKNLTPEEFLKCAPQLHLFDQYSKNELFYEIDQWKRNNIQNRTLALKLEESREDIELDIDSFEFDDEL